MGSWKAVVGDLQAALRKLLSGVIGGLLLGCSTVGTVGMVETVPRVSVGANRSGLEVGAIKSEGPSVQGAIGTVPTRTVIEVKRVGKQGNTEGRYFIRASGTVQVVSIERAGDYPEMAENVAKWRKLVASPSVLGASEQEMLDTTRLPEVPGMNAARVFHGKLRRSRFAWGDAVWFLTSYVQGGTGGPVNNAMLVLVIQGLTKDGRYAVNGRLEIGHPSLPDSSWDERQKGMALFAIDDEGKEAQEWLDAQGDDEFTPSFSQYEAFLGALRISPGEPLGLAASEPVD